MTGSKRVSTIVPNYNYRWRAVKEYLEGLASTIRRHLALEKIVPKYNNRWRAVKELSYFQIATIESGKKKNHACWNTGLDDDVMHLPLQNSSEVQR